jgi:diketogulonate reductase-like aldo/keto reductase
VAYEVPKIALNNGVEMPSIGLGVFQTPPDETRSAVAAAPRRLAINEILLRPAGQQ